MQNSTNCHKQKLNDFYNISHQKNTEKYVSNSLFDFLKQEIFPQLRDGDQILEVGCGQISLFENFDQFDITAIDFAAEAIRRTPKESKVHYLHADIFEYSPKQKFDLIFDAHLFHCLSLSGEMEEYLLKIKTLMQPQGIFAMEVMVQSEEMQFEFDQFFDYSDGILYENELPIRKILPEVEIEKMIIDAGFKMKFFRVEPGLKIIPNKHREEALSTDPDILRVILAL